MDQIVGSLRNPEETQLCQAPKIIPVLNPYDAHANGSRKSVESHSISLHCYWLNALFVTQKASTALVKLCRDPANALLCFLSTAQAVTTEVFQPIPNSEFQPIGRDRFGASILQRSKFAGVVGVTEHADGIINAPSKQVVDGLHRTVCCRAVVASILATVSGWLWCVPREMYNEWFLQMFPCVGDFWPYMAYLLCTTSVVNVCDWWNATSGYQFMNRSTSHREKLSFAKKRRILYQL